MARAFLIALLLARAALAAGPEALPCGTGPGRAPGVLALHRYWAEVRRSGATRLNAAADRDVGAVTVLEDRGDLVARRNLFDLDSASLRFSPNAAGGYDVARLELGLDAPATPLALATGGLRVVDLPFRFPFFGRAYDRVFVDANGSLAFAVPDLDAGPPELATLLAGPPRVAAFFAGLDPDRGGSISTALLTDRAGFRWADVPGQGQINHNSFEIVLHPSGSIDLVFGRMETREAVVGVSPGGVLELAAADLSAGEPRGSAAALVERFRETEELDLVSASRRFLATHPDLFEQLVVYTTRPLNPLPGTLAFELNVRNEIAGIGVERSDLSAQYGSGGALASIVYMDAIDQYLDSDGFEILGHEVGHRWLARLRFRQPDGSESPALLGRGGVHWSFFLDSEASVMEGNRIADGGGGRFETVDFARGFSALDQYVMGLRSPAEVPPFFYVEQPDDFRPNRGYKASSAPEAGVSFTGLRRDVRIEDVIAAMGARLPAAAEAPRLLRQAFVLVADAKAPGSEARIAALSRIREHFSSWYREATGGRAAVDSSLP